jgi:hypothetical protein
VGGEGRLVGGLSRAERWLGWHSGLGWDEYGGCYRMGVGMVNGLGRDMRSRLVGMMDRSLATPEEATKSCWYGSWFRGSGSAGKTRSRFRRKKSVIDTGRNRTHPSDRHRTGSLGLLCRSA